jgi:hypothetical protein
VFDKFPCCKAVIPKQGYKPGHLVVCEKNGIIVEKAQMSTATVLIMNILVI